MPVCPNCQKETKRKNGNCGLCGEPLQLYAGRFYREGVTPIQSILVRFEKLVSDQLTKAQGIPVPFHVSKKTLEYKRSCVEAERLLETCEYDLDLVLETLDILFTNKQFAYKTRTTMIGLNRDTPVALAIARAARAVKDKQNNARSQTFEEIMGREDIFA